MPVEPLQRLTRKQLETLQYVEHAGTTGHGVPLKDLARRFRIASPTALGHLTALEQLGLVERFRGKTKATRRGSETLREYVRHHRVAETIFADAGLTAIEACEAAREVDLALSHDVVEKLCRSERHPEVCPHGEAIEPCRDDARARKLGASAG
jgi:Mn-dependent DtxR family transcriptional regulator